MRYGIRALAVFGAWAVTSVWAQSPVVSEGPETGSTTRCAGAVCTAPQPVVLSPPQAREMGSATRSLLQRQAQGAEASTQQYTMSGAVAQKVYERYVNSFKHPIPEHSASAIAKAGSGSK